mgnify:CR=1 FL=1
MAQFSFPSLNFDLGETADMLRDTVRTMLRQKKMSEIKNDFINNMTHEFKTPIATISLAVDALRNQKVQQDLKKMTYFSVIIND